MEHGRLVEHHRGTSGEIKICEVLLHTLLQSQTRNFVDTRSWFETHQRYVCVLDVDIATHGSHLLQSRRGPGKHTYAFIGR